MRMSKTHKLFAAAAIAALAAACATSTRYQPADRSGYGFTEQKIEDNRFRIVFSGNSLTERMTVENYLLYRAAEVTLENGYDYFVVVEDETEKETTYQGVPNPDPYFYYGRGRRFPYYGVGYGWGDDPYDYRERNRYTAMAYILLGRGEKPQDNPTAYDARQVAENLAGVIERPE